MNWDVYIPFAWVNIVNSMGQAKCTKTNRKFEQVKQIKTYSAVETGCVGPNTLAPSQKQSSGVIITHGRILSIIWKQKQTTYIIFGEI